MINEDIIEPARYFFEIGYGACWADAFIKSGEVPPFPMTGAIVDHAWQIAPECADDFEEFDRNLALTRATPSTISRVIEALTEAAQWMRDFGDGDAPHIDPEAIALADKWDTALEAYRKEKGE